MLFRSVPLYFKISSVSIFMNIVHDVKNNSKYIWVAPERTASRATYNTFLANKVFVSNLTEKNYFPGLVKKSKSGYSHRVQIPETEYKNGYKVIFNARNPYFQLVSMWKMLQIEQLRLDNRAKPGFGTDFIFNNLTYRFTKSHKYYPNPIKQEPGLPKVLTFREFFNEPFVANVNQINPLKDGIEIKYPVRTEHFIADIIKIPFVEIVSDSIQLNDTKILELLSLVKRHFVASLIKTGTVDVKHYLDFMKAKGLYEESSLKTIYKRDIETTTDTLNAITDEHLEELKNCYVVSDFFREHLIVWDLYEISQPSLTYYNQDLADTVYKLRKEWFEIFNYNKDSWRQ